MHALLFSPAYIQSLQRIFGNDKARLSAVMRKRLIRWMSSDPRMIDVEGRLQEMTKWDIDMQVLPVPFPTAHWCRIGRSGRGADKAGQRRNCAGRPQSSRPIPGVVGHALQFPELAVNELDRFASRPEVVGTSWQEVLVDGKS